MSVGRLPRIGILANTLEQNAGPDAGGHVHFLEVARRWDWADVVIFAPEFGREAFLRRAPNASFVAMPDCDAALPGKALQFLARALLGIARRSELRRCDALVATSTSLPDVVPAAVCPRRRNLVIVHHLITGATERDGPFLRNAIAYLAEQAGLAIAKYRFGSVACLSERTATTLRRLGFLQTIVITSNGVDHQPVPASSEPRSGTIFVGRMHPTKGVDDLVRAWRHVVDALPHERLTLIGAADDAAFERDLSALVTELGLDASIDRLGRASDGEKVARLARASVFAFPSKEEGWGIALGEAMRAGLPCVTYDLPVFAEIFPRGRLESPVGDVEAFANNLIRILTDDAMRARLAEEARALARAFTWQRVADIEAIELRRMLAT